MQYKKIDTGFYNRKDVLTIASELLGKLVVTNVNGEQTTGRIVETEAYAGIHDKASHAFGGRRTSRNEHMYREAGVAYVYVCYGIHQMLNVVTNAKGIPDAVLIRALVPVEGIAIMSSRTGKLAGDKSLTSGPGNVCKALGINKSWSGRSLAGEDLFIADDGMTIRPEEIGTSARIGVESAGKDATLPYRFFIKGNAYVSGRKNKTV